MILLEQNIELLVSHCDKFKRYDVIELLKDDEGTSFKIFCDDSYLFTIIPTMTDRLTFKLAETDRKRAAVIDQGLYIKIKASLYSLFLNQPLS